MAAVLSCSTEAQFHPLLWIWDLECCGIENAGSVFLSEVFAVLYIACCASQPWAMPDFRHEVTGAERSGKQ
jgi:hypothetical protein